MFCLIFHVTDKSSGQRNVCLTSLSRVLCDWKIDIERLIEEVRKFPVLYDQTNEKYRNTEYKDRVWKKIATNMQVKGGIEECKKRWTSIRDQFRKTLQKSKTVSGQVTVRQNKYKYEDQLIFLVPYMIERETISNVSYIQGDNESEQEFNTEERFILEEEDMQQDNVIDKDQITQGCEIPNVTRPAQLSQGSLAASSVTSKKKNTFTKPLLKRKLQRANERAQETASSQLMAYILAERQAENQAKRPLIERAEQNPVNAFLTGIAPALKALHPILFHQAKNKIFSIVQEYELKQLLNNEQMRQFPPSSSDSSSSVISTPHLSLVENETLINHTQETDSHDSTINNKTHYRPSQETPESSVPFMQNTLHRPEPFFLNK